MGLNERKFYVIKQSNGTTWNFCYNENTGIIYRVLNKNKWPSYHVVTDKSTENFSVVLLADDSICVLYQDTVGHINLSMYNGKEWSEQQILKNEQVEAFQVCFKAIVYENHIHIIYNILNKKNGIGTLFHQTLDGKNNLSSPKIIDIIKFEYQIPFILFASEGKGIFIMYQKLIDSHQIGYKTFNKDMENWSDFYLIDKSSNPYKDYSMIVSKNKLYLLYIKDEQDTNSLTYVHINNINFKHNKLVEGTNIDLCSLFILYDQVWCSWVQENRIHSRFSIDNGDNFSNPPYSELLTSPNIVKAIYSSNNIKGMKDLIVSEIYLMNEEALKYLAISNIYSNINSNDNNDNGLSCVEYFMDRIHEILSIYEKKFIQKEKFIDQLNYMLEEQKLKSLLYEKKFKEINKSYAKFKEGKQLLNENISYLQESIITKEQKINELENINIEKDNEILCLKEKISEQKHKNLPLVENVTEEKISQSEDMNAENENDMSCLKEEISKQEHKILSLVEETKNLKEYIKDLSSQLSIANSKLNNSFFKRIFNNE
jgi:Chromosome segregation ATPases